MLREKLKLMKRIRKDDELRKEYDIKKLKPAPANRRPKVSLTDLISALPKPLRDFIHDLETRADPAGDVRENHFLREENAALRVRIQTLQRKIKRLERKPTSDVVSDYHNLQCRICDQKRAIDFRPCSYVAFLTNRIEGHAGCVP